MIDRGYCGGKITFLQSEYRETYIRHLLGKGRSGVLSGKLYLVITREPGTGQYAIAASLNELGDMDYSAMMFAVTKGDLTLLRDGITLPRPESSGQNKRFLRSALTMGWDIKATEENADDSGKPFDVTLDDGPAIIHARASWIDLAILHRKLAIWAKGILPKMTKLGRFPSAFPPQK